MRAIYAGHGGYCDCQHCEVERAFERGRTAERAAVVAWLRQCAETRARMRSVEAIADEVERGEHLEGRR